MHQRQILGLIVGCGVGDLGDGTHEHIHPAQHFLTVDLLAKANPDYVMPMQHLIRDEEFMAQYAGKLECVVFENNDQEILDPDRETGHSIALDIAYALLKPGGVCIISVGGFYAYSTRILSELAGFKVGAYLREDQEQVDSILIVQKKSDPGVFVFQEWLLPIIEHLTVPKYTAHEVTMRPLHDLKEKLFTQGFPNELTEENLFSTTLHVPGIKSSDTPYFDSTIARNYDTGEPVLITIPEKPAIRAKLDGVIGPDDKPVTITNIKRSPMHPTASIIKDNLKNGKGPGGKGNKKKG